MATPQPREVSRADREPRPSGLPSNSPWASPQPPSHAVATLPHTFCKGQRAAASAPASVSSGCYNKTNPRRGGLNGRHTFHSSGLELPDRGASRPGSWAPFSLCPHMVQRELWAPPLFTKHRSHHGAHPQGLIPPGSPPHGLTPNSIALELGLPRTDLGRVQLLPRTVLLL